MACGKLLRVREDGHGMQQLTDDERVDWFPHLSSDGTRMLYLSYEPGTEGHPANRRVHLPGAEPAPPRPEPPRSRRRGSARGRQERADDDGRHGDHPRPGVPAASFKQEHHASRGKGHDRGDEDQGRPVRSPPGTDSHSKSA